MPVTKVSDNSSGVGVAVKALLKSKVYVGIPDTTAERQPEPGESGTPISNAAIGYVQEFGLPEKNIPARPFLLPGCEDVRNEIAMRLVKAGEAALTGNPAAVERALEAVGTVASSAVKQKITDGPFTPLSQRTIEARARRGRAGAKKYLKLLGEGTPKEVLDDMGDQALVKPLIDTGALRRAVTYVVRNS